MNKSNFFGYGILRNKRILAEIIHHEPDGGSSAILENYNLCVQTLDLIPNFPRDILQKVWGQNFRSYTLKKGNGIVSGIVWKLSEEDLTKISRWDFIPEWKEIIKVQVKTFSEKIIESVTTKVYDNQSFYALIDGINYENNLNPQGKMPNVSDTEVEEQYKIKALEKIRENLELTQKLEDLKTKI